MNRTHYESCGLMKGQNMANIFQSLHRLLSCDTGFFVLCRPQSVGWSVCRRGWQGAVEDQSGRPADGRWWVRVTTHRHALSSTSVTSVLHVFCCCRPAGCVVLCQQPASAAWWSRTGSISSSACLKVGQSAKRSGWWTRTSRRKKVPQPVWTDFSFRFYLPGLLSLCWSAFVFISPYFTMLHEANWIQGTWKIFPECRGLFQDRCLIFSLWVIMKRSVDMDEIQGQTLLYRL